MNALADNGGESVSGGELKRTGLGIELVTEPLLLIMDEISSGQDSHTALSMMLALKRLAIAGKTIILSIHAPSKRMFQLFDDLILLSGGQVVYQGPASGAVPWFMSQGLTFPVRSNEAEVLVKHIYVNKDDQKSTELVRSLIEANIIQNMPCVPIAIDDGQLQIRPITGAPWGKQFTLLAARSWRHYARRPQIIGYRALQYMALSLFVGLVYLHVPDNQDGIYGRIGFIFFLLAMLCLTTVTSTVLILGEERPLFWRELESHRYSVLAYFAAKTIWEIPIQCILAFTFGLPGYFMVGLQPGGQHFGIFMAGLMLLANAMQSIGLIVAISAPPLYAAIISPLSVVPFMICCGFFIHVTSVPDWLIWLQEISPMLYTFRPLMVNEMQNLPLYCTAGQMVTASANGTDFKFCEFTSGTSVLTLLGFQNADIAQDLLICFALAVAFRILAATVIWIMARQKNHRKAL